MHHIAAPRVVCSALLVAASKGVPPADVFCALPLPISHAVPVAGHQCATPLIKGQAGGPHRALLRANQGRNHALHSAAGQQEVQEGHIQVVATAGEQAWQTQPMQHPASQESDAEPSQLDGGTGMAPSHLQQAQAPNPFANGSAGFTSAGPFGNQPLDAGSPVQPAPVGEQVFGDSTPVTRVVHHHRSDSLAIAAPATEHSEPSFENPPQFAVQAAQVGFKLARNLHCIGVLCCFAGAWRNVCPAAFTLSPCCMQASALPAASANTRIFDAAEERAVAGKQLSCCDLQAGIRPITLAAAYELY